MTRLQYIIAVYPKSYYRSLKRSLAEIKYFLPNHTIQAIITDQHTDEGSMGHLTRRSTSHKEVLNSLTPRSTVVEHRSLSGERYYIPKSRSFKILGKVPVPLLNPAQVLQALTIAPLSSWRTIQLHNKSLLLVRPESRKERMVASVSIPSARVHTQVLHLLPGRSQLS